MWPQGFSEGWQAHPAQTLVILAGFWSSPYAAFAPNGDTGWSREGHATVTPVEEQTAGNLEDETRKLF